MASEELVSYLEEKKVKGIKSRYNLSIITNVILIIMFIALSYYIYNNIEEFKALGQDACRLCESKTGGSCLSQNHDTIVASIRNVSTPTIYAPVNFSGMLIN